jgi:multidrug resistance efflux pump
MSRTICYLLLAGLVGLVLVTGRPAAQDVAEPQKGSPPVPPVAKVQKGTLKAEVNLKGVIEAEQMTEVAVKLQAWAGPLSVVKAVPQGTPVKKGDVLVEFDAEKLDQAIADLKADRALAELALKQAEKELPVLKESLPIDLAAAERAKKQADEDFKKFVGVDRPLSEQSAEHALKNSKHFLDYAREELKQLEKMYRSKDLTEETEEIILKRQRNQVESAAFALKTATIRNEQTLKVDLPRQEQAAKDKAAKESLALEKARNTLPLAVSQKELALTKLKYDNHKTVEKLAKLVKDRETMTVHAPADGVVYYGRSLNGQWGPLAMTLAKLQRGGAVMADEVFMTVVTPRPFFIRATVEEKDLHLLRPDLKGKAVLAGYPDRKLSATLVRLSAVPQAPGTFEARLAVEPAKDDFPVMPGMACTVHLLAYKKADALTVPAAAVFSDEEEAHYVYLSSKEKRPVKVGRTCGGKTEILEGLSEGDKVLTAKPEGN